MEPNSVVRHELRQFLELRRRLVEAVPDLDEPTLLGTLEGATNLGEALGGILRSVLDDEDLAEALTARLGAMKLRLARLEATAQKKRQVAVAAMEEAGLEKIREPDFTASLRTVPGGLIVTDGQLIPEWFWIPQPAKLDRRGVLDAIKAGTVISGAELENSRVTISIRTK